MKHNVITLLNFFVYASIGSPVLAFCSGEQHCGARLLTWPLDNWISEDMMWWAHIHTHSGVWWEVILGMHAEWEQRCGGALDTDTQNAHFKIICQTYFENPRIWTLSQLYFLWYSWHCPWCWTSPLASTTGLHAVFLIHLHWKQYDKWIYFVHYWLIKTGRENPTKVKEAFRKISTWFMSSLQSKYLFSLSCSE